MNAQPKQVNDVYFIFVDHKKIGPLNYNQMLDLINRNQVNQNTLVMNNHSSSWFKLTQFQEFASTKLSVAPEAPPNSAVHPFDMKCWIIFDNEKRKGPYSFNEIMALNRNKKIRSSTPVLKQGMKNWIKLKKTEEFKSYEEVMKKMGAQKQHGKEQPPVLPQSPPMIHQVSQPPIPSEKTQSGLPPGEIPEAQQNVPHAPPPPTDQKPNPPAPQLAESPDNAKIAPGMPSIPTVDQLPGNPNESIEPTSSNELSLGEIDGDEISLKLSTIEQNIAQELPEAAPAPIEKPVGGHNNIRLPDMDSEQPSAIDQISDEAAEANTLVDAAASPPPQLGMETEDAAKVPNLGVLGSNNAISESRMPKGMPSSKTAIAEEGKGLSFALSIFKLITFLGIFAGVFGTTVGTLVNLGYIKTALLSPYAGFIAMVVSPIIFILSYSAFVIVSEINKTLKYLKHQINELSSRLRH